MNKGIFGLFKKKKKAPKSTVTTPKVVSIGPKQSLVTSKQGIENHDSKGYSTRIRSEKLPAGEGSRGSPVLSRGSTRSKISLTKVIAEQSNTGSVASLKSSSLYNKTLARNGDIGGTSKKASNESRPNISTTRYQPTVRIVGTPSSNQSRVSDPPILKSILKIGAGSVCEPTPVVSIDDAHIGDTSNKASIWKIGGVDVDNKGIVDDFGSEGLPAGIPSLSMKQSRTDDDPPLKPIPKNFEPVVGIMESRDEHHNYPKPCSMSDRSPQERSSARDTFFPPASVTPSSLYSSRSSLYPENNYDLHPRTESRRSRPTPRVVGNIRTSPVDITDRNLEKLKNSELKKDDPPLRDPIDYRVPQFEDFIDGTQYIAFSVVKSNAYRHLAARMNRVVLPEVGDWTENCPNLAKSFPTREARKLRKSDPLSASMTVHRYLRTRENDADLFNVISKRAAQQKNKVTNQKATKELRSLGANYFASLPKALQIPAIGERPIIVDRCNQYLKDLEMPEPSNIPVQVRVAQPVQRLRTPSSSPTSSSTSSLSSHTVNRKSGNSQEYSDERELSIVMKMIHDRDLKRSWERVKLLGMSD